MRASACLTYLWIHPCCIHPKYPPKSRWRAATLTFDAKFRVSSELQDHQHQEETSEGDRRNAHHDVHLPSEDTHCEPQAEAPRMGSATDKVQMRFSSDKSLRLTATLSSGGSSLGLSVVEGEREKVWGRDFYSCCHNVKSFYCGLCFVLSIFCLKKRTWPIFCLPSSGMGFDLGLVLS